MKTIKRFDLSTKHEICRLFMEGAYSKAQLHRDYGISGKSTLLSWLRKLGYIESEKATIQLVSNSLAKEESESEELKALKAKLLDAELRAEAYQRMIAIAEKKYKINIQKKKDTK